MKAVAILLLAVLAVLFSAAPAAAQSECSFCELAVQYIEGWIAENATEAQIERYLEVVCALAPATEAKYCDDFVNIYLPTMITYLNNNVPPEYACSLAGLCTSSMPVEIAEAIKTKLNRRN
eukprot:TRINITY_DN1165_c0_g1_i1.p1 TRINITY_DN1165_c0_g1~~TRINITY_DN1165_c0_g1_i1.p1  ORF type:complete len:121 (+),score=21.56 TRINITY_DN1165_c0_g1_i1:62-424(+)